MCQGTSTKLSTQVLVNVKNRIRQQAKSWSQMMFVWGWQMHRFYGLWIAASITFKLMCIKIATVCTIEKLHCISIKICIWYCTSRFWKKMNCIVRRISLNNLFNKTTFSYLLFCRAVWIGFLDIAVSWVIQYACCWVPHKYF